MNSVRKAGRGESPEPLSGASKEEFSLFTERRGDAFYVISKDSLGEMISQPFASEAAADDEFARILPFWKRSIEEIFGPDSLVVA